MPRPWLVTPFDICKNELPVSPESKSCPDSETNYVGGNIVGEAGLEPQYVMRDRKAEERQTQPDSAHQDWTVPASVDT